MQSYGTQAVLRDAQSPCIFSLLLLLPLSHLLPHAFRKSPQIRLTDELSRWWLFLQSHHIVSRSHWLCAKLQSHHSEGWEHALTPFFLHSTQKAQKVVFAPESFSCCNQQQGPPFCLCHKLWARLIQAVVLKCHSMLCNHLHRRVFIRMRFEQQVLHAYTCHGLLWSSHSKADDALIMRGKELSFSCSAQSYGICMRTIQIVILRLHILRISLAPYGE